MLEPYNRIYFLGIGGVGMSGLANWCKVKLMKEIAGYIALGALALPQLKSQLDYMKDKYAGVDVDIENLADLLRTGAMDLDNLCKLVPNIQTQGVNVEIKATPTSLPDIDPVAILRGGAIPEFPTSIETYIETSKVNKKATDDFLNIELPTFDF